MSPEELATIKAFAAGDKSLREDAIAIHRKYLQDQELRDTNAMLFMSEVDNPCPDYILRNRYRRLLTQ